MKVSVQFLWNQPSYQDHGLIVHGAGASPTRTLRCQEVADPKQVGQNSLLIGTHLHSCWPLPSDQKLAPPGFRQKTDDVCSHTMCGPIPSPVKDGV